MGGVISGFAIIAGVIATGYVLGRRGSLGENGREVLTRLAFHVATPALLFVTLSRADLSAIVSSSLLVSALSTLAVVGAFLAFGAARGWGVGPSTVGALCSGYVNAGNLGIPIAVYVLHDASVVAPVLLFQQLVLTPVALTALDLAAEPASASAAGAESGDRSGAESGAEGRWAGVARRLVTPFRNPVVLGSLGGVSVAACGLTVPHTLLEPVTLVGNMAVPAVLLAFGISLRGSAVPGRGPERSQVLLSVLLKSVVQPAVAWLLTVTLFPLGAADRLNVVVIAALPAAQNLFTYASRYATGTRLARESILLSTALSVPVLTVTAALLG
ncbi:AEC family transporter [Streptomyces hoynatensis]|uniref:AEC family transporter n=1 Tax=Streptomyces hoynatensis TaxID=1141874 RepID=A0A3A9YQN9_9ACTN|nr:AEC family transporter [Streptomyces hoynatensis]RKN37536.1 AEC family transporter [Streptomyces hoynatensis]